MFSRALFHDFKNPPDDFSLDLYLLAIARRKKYRIITLPVHFEKRLHGTSKWAYSFKGKVRAILRTIKGILRIRKNINSDFRKPDSMRICSPELGISPTSNSGGEVHDREILTALAALGVEMEILLPKGKVFDTSIAQWHVQRAPLSHIVPPYLFNLLVIPYLRKTYRERPFDLLRVHSPYFVGLGALLFRRRHPTVPLVATYHHLEPSLLYDAIDRRWIRAWDRIITVSAFTRSHILDRYEVDPAHVVAVHNGVGPQFRPMLRDEERARRWGLQGKRVLLFVGGLKARKNLPFLLTIAAQLPRATNAVLIIAGAGPEDAKLRAQAEALGVADRVVFPGYVTENEKVALYNLADIFLLPSVREGFGMVAAEAMACGTPALVPRNQAFTEFIRDGSGGFLLPPNDSAAWVDAIVRLLGDDALRRSVGETGRVRITQEFSWERAAQRHLQVYEEAIAEGLQKLS